jgi:hypothetical protein
MEAVRRFWRVYMPFEKTAWQKSIHNHDKRMKWGGYPNRKSRKRVTRWKCKLGRRAGGFI